jgi:hypothetical protein
LASPSEIEVPPNQTAQLDLTLTETKDVASQLMNAEWLMSVEKAGKGKQIEKLECVGCHSLTRIFTSKHSAESWGAVLDRMRTYGQGGRKLPFPPPPRAPDPEFAKFLSSINLSSSDQHTGGMHTDYLYRLSPETGEVTQYLLPTVNVNIRNMGGVDNRSTPVTIWIGENHRNKIARVEPLD